MRQCIIVTFFYNLYVLCSEITIYSSPPLAFTLPGCPSRSAPPALVVWELAGAFRLFLRASGTKWGWMLRWVVAGGGLRLKYNFRVIKFTLYPSKSMYIRVWNNTEVSLYRSPPLLNYLINFGSWETSTRILCSFWL